MDMAAFCLYRTKQVKTIMLEFFEFVILHLFITHKVASLNTLKICQQNRIIVLTIFLKCFQIIGAKDIR